MMKRHEFTHGATITGDFEVGPGRWVFGKLSLDGERSQLYLRDPQFFSAIGQGHIKGKAHDLACLSLFGCVGGFPGNGWTGRESYSFAEVFPHHIVHGRAHLAPEEQAIRSIHFSIDDGNALFSDFDALGTVVDAKRHIRAIANANKTYRRRSVRTGPYPVIQYFTGRSRLLEVKAGDERIIVSNIVDRTLGSAEQFTLRRRTGFEISFGKSVAFSAALSAAIQLTRFLALMVGRPQNRLGLILKVGKAREPTFLNVYSTMIDPIERSDDARKPSPRDMLIQGVEDAVQMGQVLGAWLEMDRERRDARLRFAHSFAQENRFSEDRLIAAANMFDLLPDSAVPKKVQTAPDLAQAVERARKIFEPLPDTPERHSILSALGRVGTSSLPRKALHRAKIVSDALPGRLPELDLVVREAIKCRNRYVHGSEGTFDYRAYDDAVSFFTSTLELVFGASDLIECGWDIVCFEKQRSSEHPFANLIGSWRLRLDGLKSHLPASQKA
jgi:hypothetical protein